MNTTVRTTRVMTIAELNAKAIELAGTGEPMDNFAEVERGNLTVEMNWNDTEGEVHMFSSNGEEGNTAFLGSIEVTFGEETNKDNFVKQVEDILTMLTTSHSVETTPTAGIF